MKNAAKHADNLRSLFKKLLKEGKPDPRPADLTPLRALVMGILSFDTTDNKANQAIKIIDDVFVDINELRVATELEVIQIIGPRYPQIEQRALMFRETLNQIFEKEHTLSLDRIKTLGKKEVRAFLKELPEMTPFVEAYTMLIGLESTAVPVDESTLAMLREHDVVEADSTIEDTQKFLEANLKADEIYDFHFVIRRALFNRKK